MVVAYGHENEGKVLDDTNRQYVADMRKVKEAEPEKFEAIK
jgi:hypothetical protein